MQAWNQINFQVQEGKIAILIVAIFFVFYSSCNSSVQQKHSASKNEYSLSKSASTDKLNNNEESAEIKLVDSVTFNFGSVKAGDTVSHTFHFKNTGEVPLIIKSATATCGCTVGHYSSHPIIPNQIDSITAIFISRKDMHGFQNKVVTVNYNSPHSPKLLTLYGSVN